MEKIVQKAIKLHKDLVEKFEKEEAGKLVEITELIVKSLDKGGRFFYVVMEVQPLMHST